MDSSILVARDHHALHQDRAARAAAAHHHVAAYGRDSFEHFLEVAGDGDLLDRKADLAAFYPVAGGASRVVAGHGVHALPHELGDEEASVHELQHAGEVGALRAYEEVVVPAGVARSLHSQLARRVAAEEVPLHYARPHNAAIARTHALVVEGSARHRAAQVRALIDVHERREHLAA